MKTRKIVCIVVGFVLMVGPFFFPSSKKDVARAPAIVGESTGGGGPDAKVQEKVPGRIAGEGGSSGGSGAKPKEYEDLQSINNKILERFADENGEIRVDNENERQELAELLHKQAELLNRYARSI